MFKNIYQKFKNLYNKKIDAKGLAIFRIVFCLVMLGEVIELFYFRHLIFDKIPYLILGEIDMSPVFFFWIISLVFMLFGAFTRIASIINYILTVTVLGTISSFEYHMFYSYLIISFLFIFLPVSKSFSLDRLRLKLKYSNTRFRYEPSQEVSVLSYYVPILLGIGFVYFDSVFFKLSSHLWLNGLGLWLPSSMPQAVFLNISSLLNIKYLVLGLGYLTLIFETIFLFTFWRKKWRLPLLIIGVGLHIGILVCFPIPFFALGVSGLYILMVPVFIWDRIFKRNQSEVKLIKFFYDGECPLCNRTRIILSHFDSRKRIEFLTVQENADKESILKDIPKEKLLDNIHAVSANGKIYSGVDVYIKIFNTIWYLKPLSWFMRLPGIYQMSRVIYRTVALNRTTNRCTEDNCGYVLPELPIEDSKMKLSKNYTLKDLRMMCLFVGISILIMLQALVTYNAPVFKIARIKAGIANVKVIKVSVVIANLASDFSKTFFGITHHGVFMDSHFDGYNHTIAVIYKPTIGKEIWLPIFDENGTPGDYLSGPLWVKWTFRVNSPLVNQTRLVNGIRDFTAFWAKKNGVNLQSAKFEIRVKKTRVPKKWEFNFLNDQLHNPWLHAGEVNWRNSEFSSNVLNIEEL